MTPRPKLVPLSVGWMISPSTPMLRICVSEETVQSPTMAEFLAVYQSGQEAQMKLIFQHGLWVAFNPSYSDKEIVPIAAYDWSAVHVLDMGAKFASSISLFQDTWKDTGICPDPRAYEVQGSRWLERISEQAGTDNYKHFLLLGHDSYVEVLAQSWRAISNEDSA